MGRGSSRDLVRNIASALGSEPKSVQDISKEIGADRGSVEKYLESLKSAGVAGEHEGLFFLRDWKQEESDAYFNLPLSEERRQRTESLFALVSELYEEKVGKPPSRIKAQKIAVRAAKRAKIDVPRGGYRHGSMAVMSYDPETEYENTGLEDEEKVRETVEKGIEDFAGADFPGTKRIQYEEEDMELYLLKEKITEQLAGEVNGELQKNLYRFLSHLPPLEKDSEDFVVDFVAIAPDLVDDRSTRAKLFEAFQSLWEMVAIYRFYEDLCEFYPEVVLENQLRRHIEDRKAEALEAVSELVDLHESDYDLGDFEELKGSAEELSEEQKKRRKKELEDMDQSDVLGEYGLD